MNSYCGVRLFLVLQLYLSSFIAWALPMLDIGVPDLWYPPRSWLSLTHQGPAGGFYDVDYLAAWRPAFMSPFLETIRLNSITTIYSFSMLCFRDVNKVLATNTYNFWEVDVEDEQKKRHINQLLARSQTFK